MSGYGESRDCEIEYRIEIWALRKEEKWSFEAAKGLKETDRATGGKGRADRTHSTIYL